MQVWTNNYFMANVHRVVNRDSSGADRYSAVFFFDPSLDATIRPLEGLYSTSDGADPMEPMNNHAAALSAREAFRPVEPFCYGEMAFSLYRNSIPNEQHNQLQPVGGVRRPYQAGGAGALRCSGCRRVVTCSCP
jgi:hypothetical protein